MHYKCIYINIYIPCIWSNHILHLLGGGETRVAFMDILGK